MIDRELAHQVTQRSSQKAFAEIVHRYSGMVFSKALGVMRSEEGAAEVTQQTFAKTKRPGDGSLICTEITVWHR